MNFTSLPSAIAAVLSFSTYTALALFQSLAEASQLAIYKDVGMGAAFIGTCVFMFRYFTTQIEKKDAANQDMTNKFLQVIENKTRTDAELREQMLTLVEKVEALHDHPRFQR